MRWLPRLPARHLPPPPPPARALRNGIIAGGIAAGAVSSVSAIAYLQARLAVSNEPYVTTPLDGHVDGENGVLCRIVWLGDSLAAGMGAISPELSIPRLVATGRNQDTRLHVFAVPGATSEDVIRTQLPALHQLRHGLGQIGQRIDAIGITVGANDISSFTPRHRFRANVRKIVLAADGAPVVLVSIPQLSDAIRLPRPLRTIASVRALWLDLVLRKFGRERDDVHYASVRRRPDWIRRRDLRNFLAADRFHPSGAGYALWADHIIEAFDTALAPAATTTI
ncbi:SGNH/GDSL hydrolase family protein [Actinospongicola halichondriae]|uniref:SGNH/GDSL hydrolase family protein n=1 Tax=Actinospongicola halichondriae TaxID=3236844 RepID=UPI003D4B2BE0